MNEQLSPLNLLKNLIRFKTEAENTNELKRCAIWIKKQFEPLLPVKLVFNNNIPLLVMGQTDLKKTKILLLGHCDIVSGKDEQFIPKIKKGKIYGRGATDNKGPIAGLMGVLLDVYPKIKNITLAIVFDEEVGSAYGSKIIAEQVNKDLDIVFIPDAGGNFSLCTGSLGVWQFKILSKGKSVHASDAKHGDNAITKICNFWAFIESIYNKRAHYYSLQSVNLGKIEGGTSTNTVPDSALAFFDIRYKNDKRFLELKQTVKEYIETKKGLLSEEILVIKPVVLDTKHPIYSSFFNFLVKENGKVTTYVETSANDSRFFSDFRCPIIMTKPRGGGAHSDEEWIDLESLNRFRKIIAKFIIEKFTKKQ